MMFWRQLRGELWKLFARKRTYIGFGTFVAVEIAILALLTLPKAQNAFARLMRNNGLSFEESYTGLTLAVYIVFFTFVLRGLYVALVAGDLVAKEVEEGTMRMVLSRPVSRARLFWLKAITNVVHTFVLMFFIGITSLLAAGLYRHGLGKLIVCTPHEHVFAVFSPTEGLWRYFRAIFFMGIAFQVIGALGLMFSCCKMRPAAATVLTLSVLFADFVLSGIPYFESFSQYFLNHHLTSWIRTFHEVVQWTDIASSLALLAGLTATFWIAGLVIFCSRDFKS